MNDEITKLFVTLGLNATGYTEGMSEAKKTAGGFGDTWVKATAVMAGAAVGIEALARAQAPLTESTKQLAASTGITEAEMRKLVIATSNVTFPLESVLEVMEKGREQGIKSAEGLQQYATFWDVVGDATGQNATVLAEAGVALRAVGIAAGEESEALAAFGYITRETSMNVGEFLEFVGKAGPELRQMGMDVNDAAAVLGILEKEFGMTGRTARSEFNAAVKEANGDMDALLQILGITEEQFNNYNQAVEESSEVIAENAAIHAESYTAMQKIQHAMSEATYAVGSYIGKAAELAPLLTGASAAITLAERAKGSLSVASTLAALSNIRFTITTVAMNVASTAAAVSLNLLGRAFLFATGPMGIAVLAITAVIGVGYLLIKNFDKIGDTATAVWTWAGDKIKGFKDTASVAIDFVIKRINALISAMNKIPGVNIGKISTTGGETPKFHSGGIYRAPTPGGEGMALLRDGERITPAGAVATANQAPATPGIDYNRMGSAVASALKGFRFSIDLKSGIVEVVQDALRSEVRA